MKTILISFFVIGLSFFSYPQEIKVATGVGKVQMTMDETLVQVKERAKVEAELDALNEAFGTGVYQESNLNIIAGKSYFNYIGTTRVGGEIHDVLDEKYTRELSESGDAIWITCTIKVKVSPATPKADIETFSLNLPDVQSRSQLFKSGDELYLYFKSPVSGYLSVYLDDNKDISKLFPYHQDVSHPATFPVEADKEYILFQEKVIDDNLLGHELELYTPLEKEGNILHVFFSESDFKKPMVNKPKQLKNGGFTPETVTRKNYERWIKNTKSNFKDFIDYPIPIEITSE